MKLLNLFVLATSLISASFAAKQYQITYYGCPRECHSQKHPSCGLPTYPLEKDGTKYFCALSTKLEHYKEYCGKQVVVMLTDGTKNMIKVQVVDSCSSCPKYHVDLSQYSFPHLLELKKGEADCIWSIYDDDGTRLIGPIYNSVDKAVSKLGMSKDSFLKAFDSSAKKLVRSSEHVGKLGSSSSGSDDDDYDYSTSTTKTKSSTRKKSTTTRTSTKKKTTTRRISSLPPKHTTSLPPKHTINSFPPKHTTYSLPPKHTTSLPSKHTINSFPPKHTTYLPAKQTPSVIPSKNIADQTSYNEYPGFQPQNNGNGFPNVPSTNGEMDPPGLTAGFPNVPPTNGEMDPPGLTAGFPNVPPTNGEMDPAGLTAGFPNEPSTNVEMDPPGLTAGFPDVPPEQLNNPDASKTEKATPILSSPPKKNEKDNREKSGVDAKVGIACACVGGTLGAAGIGLLLMKKKSPGTYEGIKRKFPEAFSTVRRSLSRKNTRETREIRVPRETRENENFIRVPRETRENENFNPHQYPHYVIDSYV
ncbi:hypothetical protein BCR32DRAFT_272110 [Anaeromyces robustus]|uniref:RlpA-like protein double-psi beta-barrel domain-containing protein n=1 Tax=Anaeromyces robustus TaxID=1754192 RepID=A0A1Y1WNI6_9FUNG|nr:hypothetical protein BCR32DRAFT_272110 [Anaeromyces robustus]|eukprot:ORX75119.1 hypothetical protein BCR32DRAFT_272110 [Anaeromyces robustus]